MFGGADNQMLQACITRVYLYQIAYGQKQASPEIAARIERATTVEAEDRAWQYRDQEIEKLAQISKEYSV